MVSFVGVYAHRCFVGCDLALCKGGGCSSYVALCVMCIGIVVFAVCPILPATAFPSVCLGSGAARLLLACKGAPSFVGDKLLTFDTLGVCTAWASNHLSVNVVDVRARYIGGSCLR